MDAERHDLVVHPLCRCGPLEAWIPGERSRDLAPIRKRNDKLRPGDLNGRCLQIANLNFQSAHSRHPRFRCGAVSNDIAKLMRRKPYIECHAEIAQPNL